MKRHLAEITEPMAERYEVVYSSDEFCGRCRSAPCQCGKPARQPQGARVRPATTSERGGPKMRLERAGRRGKAVTVVSNLVLGEAQMRAILSEVKKACGTGGTVSGGHLEIQGDHRDRVESLLLKHNIKVKRAGG